MIDGGLGVGVGITCDDHVQPFSVGYLCLEGDELDENAFNLFLLRKHKKLTQLDPLTPYAPIMRTDEPSDRSGLAAMALPNVSYWISVHPAAYLSETTIMTPAARGPKASSSGGSDMSSAALRAALWLSARKPLFLNDGPL